MQALGCLGNVLWFFPFVLGTGLLWCIAGVFCFISIIGIPWGRACFVMAGFAFMPFGRMPVSRDVLTGEGDIGTGPLGTVGNIVWLLLCGIWIAALGPGLRRDNHRHPLRLAARQAGCPGPVPHRQDHRGRPRGRCRGTGRRLAPGQRTVPALRKNKGRRCPSTDAPCLPPGRGVHPQT